MDALEALAIFGAGIVAGTINAVVGSGTLLTFPVLLGFGYGPVVANVSNNIGLIPGSVSGVHGFRRELEGQGRRIVRLGVASVAGGTGGATALLVLPPGAFKAIVPGFIALAVVLVVVQPWLSRRLAERRGGVVPGGEGGVVALAAVAAAGLYGGYFGAAQGILLISILGLSLSETLLRVNALKNVLAGLVNLVAGIVFLAAAPVAWAPALLIAGGSSIGGQLGARVGRRLPPVALRALIVAVGVIAIVRLV